MSRPPHQLDYRSPPPPGEGRRRVASATGVVVAVVVVLANAALIAAAVADQSFGAMLIALAVGPFTNGLILLLALAAAVPLKAGAGGAPVSGYVSASVLLPVLAVVVDWCVVAMLPLHGC